MITYMKTHNRKGKIIMIFAIIAAVLGAVVIIGLIADGPGRREIMELTFSDVDFNFNNLKNGTYVGEYKGTKSHLRDVMVEITVSGGEVKDVRILKGAVDGNGKPVKMKGQYIDEFLKNAIQSETLDVDVISGATVTSKSHLKALEDALMKAQP